MNIPLKHIYNILVFYSKGTVEFNQRAMGRSKKPKPQKEECCEKYKKGKRCKRCPCFDVSKKTEVT